MASNRTMENLKPLVSIVMPSLNQADFIEQAIDSVLSQSYPKIELIIADGLSTDGTVDILQKKQQQDSRLKWFSDKDKGPANAINKALRLTKGSLIGWLNSDDLYAHNAIIRAVKILQEKNTVMVYGQAEHIDICGRKINNYPTLVPDVPLEQFSQGCFICQPSVFFKRTVFSLLGPLDETLKTAFDFDYWFRVFIYFSGRIAFIDKVQAQSRLHKNCITYKMRHTVALEGMQVIARYLGAAPGHWLLSYKNELLNNSSNRVDYKILQKQMELSVNEVRAYMTKTAWRQLKADILKK